MSEEFMRGASASLNKTISEIESMLIGEDIGEAGKLRKKLREKLNKTLEDVAMDWFRHGFAGGHIIAAKTFAKTKTFPRRIQITVDRNFPLRNVSEKRKSLTLRSSLKKRHTQLLDDTE